MNSKAVVGVILGAVLAAITAPQGQAQTPFIPLGSVWRYLDNDVAPPANWTQLDFDDSAWPTNRAQLGYGDGDEATIINNNRLDGTRIPAYYFRHRFVVANPSAYGSLPIQFNVDDGAVFYLNGVEIYRVRMPDGPDTHSYTGLGGTDPGVESAIRPNTLIAGTNVVAISVHQSDGASSDVSMDFELVGDFAPSVTLTAPSAGQNFVAPTNVTFAANASDTDGTVSRVEFYAGDLKLGEDTTAPYSLVWSNASDGSFVLTAIVFDNNGGSRISAPVNITITDPNPPAIAGVVAATNEVIVTFSKRVAPPSATTAGNYSIASGPAITAVSYASSASNVVVLSLATPLSVGITYTLTVNNVADFSGNPIAPNSQATFTVGDYIAQDIGNPAISGTSSVAGNGYAVSGSGTNIAGTSDQFAFNYRQVSGDFDVRLRVDSLTTEQSWAKAGLMARETLAANARHASAFATENINGAYFASRMTVGGNTTNAGSFPVGYPNTWLRLRRVGNAFTGYASLDGQNWMQLGTVTMSAPASLFYVGMAVTGASAVQAATAQFRDIGNVTGGTIGNVQLPFEPLGPSSRNTGLVISEIMYHPRLTNLLEFIEIFNAQPYPESLTGWRISGDVDYTFPPGTSIQPGQYLVVARNPSALQTAYGLSGVLGPWSGASTGNPGFSTNALPDDEGTVRLRNKNDAVLLEVIYRGQKPWPIAADGAGHSLVLVRPSYGEADYRAWAASDVIGGSPGSVEPVSADPLRSVMVNEFLAHTDDPVLDFIELYNNSDQGVNLSGAYLSDDRDTNKFRIPNGTTLPARGFLSFEVSTNTTRFALSSGGERIYLVNSSQTRVIDAVVFEAQANGVTSGRYPDGAPSFHELAASTPGAANSPLLMRPIVINEIMYHPISGDDDDEYVELYNRSGSPVNVGGWRFTDGIDYDIPPGTIIPAGGYLVVAREQTNLLARYVQLNTGNTVGDYDGSLANGGERVALSMPDYFTVTNNNVVSTQANYVVIDEVVYIDGGRWGEWSDGGGSSLELIDPDADNRLAPNWADSDETLKAPWVTVENVGGAVDNGQGAFNEVHLMILGKGECLVDDVEIRQGTAGANVVPNPDFASATGWLPRGNHVRSSLEPAGPGNPSQSFRIRATSGGDNGFNLLEADIPAQPQTGTATLRAKFRWLRGHTNVLLRVHGNWIEAPAALAVPSNLGTPGLANSRRVANAGPAITDVTHTPILPASGQAVRVTARLSDPDGIATVNLRYRLDPATGLTTLAMNDSGTAGDGVANDGIFTATIPGQASGGMIAFHIQATDASASPATFPANVVLPPIAANTQTRECLVRWGDTMPFGSFGVYRIWMSQANVTQWQTRDQLSNEAQDGTFVYGSWRVIYNAGARYRGSPFIRPGYSNPLGGNTAYVWTLPEDDLFLGADELNLDSLEPTTGAGNQRDATALREPISFWMAYELGLTFSHQRFVHIHMNGITSASRGIPVYADTQQPDSAYMASWFADDSDGEIFKIDDWFEFTDLSQGNAREFNIDASLANFTTPLPDGTRIKDQGRYRWSWEKKFNKSLNDNYSTLFTLVDAINTPTNNNQIVGAFEAVVDAEQWLTAIMLRHAVGDWDGYGYDRGKNQFFYKPAGGRINMLLWDLDFALGCNGGHGPTTGMFDAGEYNDPRTLTLATVPHFRRMCLRAFQRMVDGPFNDINVRPIIEQRHQAFVNNQVNTTSPFVNSGAQSISLPTWIAQRRANLLTHIPTNATFGAFGPTSYSTNDNFLVLRGSAPVGVKDILINGVQWPVTWTSITGWTARVALSAGANELTVNGADANGTLIRTQLLNIEYTGPVAEPAGTVVFSEIMYNPTVPDASFIEILNRSAFAFDLAGWSVNGLDYTFPRGSVLGGNQSLALVKNVGAFNAAYGTNAIAFDRFDGNLDLDGETLTLFKPQTGGAPDLVIDKVRYEARLPWAAGPNGSGSSLQLVDAAQDNSRPSNWTDRQSWRQFVYTGTIAGGASPGTNLLIFLGAAGEVYVDDIVLVTGNQPEVGPNLIVNGGFESPLAGSWEPLGNHGNSVASTAFSHSGNASLRIIATAPGGATATIRQFLPVLSSNTLCTLSIWYLPTVTASNLTIRTTPGSAFVATTSVRPAFVTPGAANSVSGTLPAYDRLWLNELQAQNTTGPADNVGEREPWIELYNAGATTLDLSGYYLADNYNLNLTQWQFPVGASIAPGEFKLIWADGQPGQTAGANLHTSFRLNSTTGAVALVRLVDNAPQITDYLTYGPLGADQSYGDFPDGQPFTRLVLREPTPRGTNTARFVNVFINEWLAGNTNDIADPADGQFEDWFELYNAGDIAVDLGGFFLTDSTSNNTNNYYRVPANGQYVIPAGGFLLVWADNEVGQNDSARPDLHVDFALGKAAERIILYGPDGRSLIDRVDFTNQTDDISEGRFPDGAPNITVLGQTTPRGPNVLTAGNTAPVIAAIGTKTAILGQPFSFTVTATDAQAGQTLTYTIVSGAPAGATLHPNSGLFSWNSAFAWAPSTNNVTVRATDDGAPPLSDEETFTLIGLPPAPTLTINGNQITLGFQTISGKTYRVEYKDDLNAATWQRLNNQDYVAAGGNLTVNDDMTGHAQRFYRIAQLD